MTSDPCRDWRGALGAAALGRLEPAEEIGLRAHLDGCRDCRAELLELTAVANALSSVPVENVTSAAAEPSDALAGRILSRVAIERGVANEGTLDSGKHNVEEPRTRTAAACAASGAS